MATKKAKAKKKTLAGAGGGVVVRGPDGRLYFIPTDELEAFALTASQRKQFEDCLSGSLAHCVQSSGVSASDSVSASDGVLGGKRRS
ncbi:MAG TPA: hypothetical protein VEU07_13240 [Candidatus Acidoferrum sp.]|nr:hypothetical protein [Candidatus Acidoferrum sp.]